MHVAHRLAAYRRFVAASGRWSHAVAEIAGRSASASRRRVRSPVRRPRLRVATADETRERRRVACAFGFQRNLVRAPVLADARTCRPPAGNVSTLGQLISLIYLVFDYLGWGPTELGAQGGRPACPPPGPALLVAQAGRRVRLAAVCVQRIDEPRLTRAAMDG